MRVPHGDVPRGAEDGASTVMLRADAGTMAPNFIGAPVLQGDSTRCEFTSR